MSAFSDKIESLKTKYQKPSDTIKNPAYVEIEKRYQERLQQQKPQRNNRLMDTEEGSWIRAAGDQISRGNYAPANLALETIRGNVGTIQEAFAAHQDGLTLRKKTTWGDVVDEVMPGAHPWIRTGLGFAGDVVLDEFNFIPMGWIAKTGKMLGIGKVLDIAADIPGVQSGLRAFKPGHELSKVKPLTKDFRFENAYKHKRDLELKINSLRRTNIKETTERTNLFRKTAIALGADPDEASAMLIKQRQTGLAKEVLPEYREFYEHAANGYRKIHKDEVAAGIIKNATYRNNYFPGIYEKGRLIIRDGKQVIGNPTGYWSNLSWKNKTPFSQGKKWDTVEIAERELTKIQAKGIAEGILPVNDWFKGYAIRKFVSDSAIAWKGYIDEAVDNFAIPMTKKLGDANVQALKGFAASGDMESARKLIGNIQLEKGYSFVTKATNLRSPKMEGFVLKETQRALQMSDESTAVSNLADLFQKKQGKGLVDISVDDIVKMGIDDVYLMPNEIAKSVKNAFKPFAGSETTSAFMKGLDSANSMWKTMATAMRVAFHPRNGISGFWHMYLGDVNPAMIPSRLAAAARVQNGSKSFVLNGFTAADLTKSADRVGINSYGFMGSDMPQKFQEQLQIATKGGRIEQALEFKKSTTPVIGPAITGVKGWAAAGRKLGQAIEDNARLGTMIDQIKKTGLTKASLGEITELKKLEDKIEAIRSSVKPGLADSHPMLKDLVDKAAKMKVKVNREVEFNKIAEHVKDFHYDYTEVTEFEKDVMGRAMPFYKWLRKNIPRQIESLVTRPEKFARLADFERDLWPDTWKTPPEERAVMPSWMEEGASKRTPLVDSKGNPIYVKLDLPIADLQNMGSLQSYISALNPLIPLVLTAVNARTWPEGGTINKPGQLDRAPIWAAFIPPKLGKLLKIEVQQFNDGPALAMCPKWKNALGIAFPMLKQWEIAYPRDFMKFEVKTDLGFKAISDFTGVKMIPLDLQKAVKSTQYKRKEAVRNIKHAAKRRNLTPEQVFNIYKETTGK